MLAILNGHQISPLSASTTIRWSVSKFHTISASSVFFCYWILVVQFRCWLIPSLLFHHSRSCYSKADGIFFRISYLFLVHNLCSKQILKSWSIGNTRWLIASLKREPILSHCLPFIWSKFVLETSKMYLNKTNDFRINSLTQNAWTKNHRKYGQSAKTTWPLKTVTQ